MSSDNWHGDIATSVEDDAGANPTKRPDAFAVGLVSYRPASFLCEEAPKGARK